MDIITSVPKIGNPLYNPFAMARKKAPEDLSVEELRRLLVEKRRGARKERLEHFRRTGRVMSVISEQADSDTRLSSPTVDTAEASGSTSEPVPASPRRKLMDRILLGVEVLAVIGLIVVLLNGLGLLRTLNHEVVAALNPETATPTPLVMAVVLPSGHKPPDAQGNTAPLRSAYDSSHACRGKTVPLRRQLPPHRRSTAPPTDRVRVPRISREFSSRTWRAAGG